jgi:protein required for attachment to host cells
MAKRGRIHPTRLFTMGGDCMSNLKIAQGEWVLVCDGAKALMLENEGDAKFPNLKTREVLQHDHLPNREIGTDKPGRGIDQTDWHEQNERGFLHRLIDRLDADILAGKIKKLTVVAPPRALGQLREFYSTHVRGALHAEIDKDFVKMPVHEIEKHLTAA